jgi:hypothetical protein
MIELIIACTVSSPLTPVEVDNYLLCLDTQEKVEHVIEWYPTIEEHFEPEDILKAMLVVFCESSGRPAVVGANTNGTVDIGLWQFNDITWEWLTPKLKLTSKRTDPYVSTAEASWLVYNDGWHHWSSSERCWNEYFLRPKKTARLGY